MSIKCCFISPSGKECEKEAEFTVIYGNAPNDATESCSCHIGELGDNDSGKFVVIRLNKENRSIVNMPCHTNMKSDCCGIFTVVKDDSVFCNECGMNINKAIELLCKGEK